MPFLLKSRSKIWLSNLLQISKDFMICMFSVNSPPQNGENIYFYSKFIPKIA